MEEMKGRTRVVEIKCEDMNDVRQQATKEKSRTKKILFSPAHGARRTTDKMDRTNVRRE